MRRVFVLVALMTLGAALDDCAETARDHAEAAQFTLEQQDCVDAAAGIDAEVACVRVVRERQCAAWRARFDAEVCP